MVRVAQPPSPHAHAHAPSPKTLHSFLIYYEYNILIQESPHTHFQTDVNLKTSRTLARRLAVGPSFEPGGAVFAVFVLFVASSAAGVTVARFLPPMPALVGQLVVGFLLRNLPTVGGTANSPIHHHTTHHIFLKARTKISFTKSTLYTTRCKTKMYRNERRVE